MSLASELLVGLQTPITSMSNSASKERQIMFTWLRGFLVDLSFQQEKYAPSESEQLS